MSILSTYKENRQNYNVLMLDTYKNDLETYYTDTFHNARTNDTEKYTGHQITYGELTLEGLENIRTHLAKHNIKYNNFIDIGCGKGRAVLYMSGFDNIKKSVGIELVSERANHAKDVITKMNDKYKHFLSSANIIEGDFTKQNYSEIFDKDALLFIWISNLCFSKEINAKILTKIQQEFGNRFVICCSQELPHNDSLKKIFVEPIKMSWDGGSKVHGYKPVDK